jgi:FtsH-binding integral membrane protein
LTRLLPLPLVAVGAGLLVAGIVLLATGSDVAALAVGGLGAILLAAAVFYAVGRSEDVERERTGST